MRGVRFCQGTHCGAEPGLLIGRETLHRSLETVETVYKEENSGNVQTASEPETKLAAWLR